MDLSVNLGSTPYYLWLWASPLTSLRSHFLTCEIRTIVKPTSQLLNEWNSTIYAEDIARDQAHGEYAQMRAPVLGINGTCLTNCKYEKKPERTITLLFLAWCCEGKQRQSGKEVLICWVCSSHCWKTILLGPLSLLRILLCVPKMQGLDPYYLVTFQSCMSNEILSPSRLTRCFL